MVDEINDARLLLASIDRMSKSDGDMSKTFSQEEVEKMLGVDTSDFEKVEIE